MSEKEEKDLEKKTTSKSEETKKEDKPKKKKRGRPKKKKTTTKKEEPKKEEKIVDTFTDDEIGVIEEEVDTNGKDPADVLRGGTKTESKTESKTVEDDKKPMDRKHFEKLVNKFDNYTIKQNDVVIANYSPYLQLTIEDTHFMLFNRKYSYSNITVEKK